MYKSLASLIIITLFLYTKSLAEEVNVIEIRYEVFVENTDSLNSYKYNLPYEAFHIVSPSNVLTLNKYAADVDEVHLYDLDELLDYRCYIKPEGESLAVKSPYQQIPTLVTNNNDERTYQIAGMLCKRYEILYKNKTIEIYTTDSFGVNFTPFSQISGYAMQYTFIDDVYGKVTYVAKSIFPTILDASAFSLDEFRITEEAFPDDVRSPFDDLIVAKESNSLFKLNRKTISYKFKLNDRTKIDEEAHPDSMIVFAIGGFQKYSPLELDLITTMTDYCKDKKVKFYHFVFKGIYSKREMANIKAAGIDIAYLKDFLLTKLKVKYYPTYILLDKDRRVVKYKIGTDSEMLSSFKEKILQLTKEDL